MEGNLHKQIVGLYDFTLYNRATVLVQKLMPDVFLAVIDRLILNYSQTWHIACKHRNVKTTALPFLQIKLAIPH